MREWLARVAEHHEPKIKVNLADMVSAVVDGGIVLSEALGDPKALSRQAMLYRAFARAVFAPE